MNKNPSPHQLSLYLAVFLTILLALLFFISKVTGIMQFEYYTLGFCLLGFTVVSYITVRVIINFFVYRKIKLIYKQIHDFKVAKEKKKDIISLASTEDIMTKVESEVGGWMQKQTREIETLRSMEKYRRNFIGDVSHELKTPIFNIQGFLFTLLEGGIEDPEINMKFLNRASRNVDRLISIVEDLDAIGRMESGSFILDIQKFNIKDLVEEVFDDYQHKADEKAIQLQFKKNASSNYAVLGDRENIRQVLSNLVSNSIKYGKEGGYTKASFYDLDAKVLIEISDDGIGMKEKDLQRIFNRFYRVDKSRSRKSGGSGLGLAIVKHIIENHNQTINVRSRIDAGSTFGFTLDKVV